MKGSCGLLSPPRRRTGRSRRRALNANGFIKKSSFPVEKARFGRHCILGAPGGEGVGPSHNIPPLHICPLSFSNRTLVLTFPDLSRGLSSRVHPSIRRADIRQSRQPALIDSEIDGRRLSAADADCPERKSRRCPSIKKIHPVCSQLFLESQRQKSLLVFLPPLKSPTPPLSHFRQTTTEGQ